MGKKRKICLIILSVLIGLTLVFIWGNSIISQGGSSRESGAVYKFFQPFLDAIFGKDVITHAIFRKFAHGTEFLVLSVELNLLFIALKRYNYLYAGLCVLLVLLSAVIDESIQILSNRGPAVLDVLIDTCGGLTGTLFTFVIYVIIKAVKGKKKCEL